MKYEVSSEVEFKESKFEILEDLKLEGDKRRNASLFAGVLSIVLFIAAAAGGFFAIRLIYPPMCFLINIWAFVYLIGGYAAYMFIHELIRGFIFILPGGVGLKDLSYGVVLSHGAVYCVSKTPVRLRRVRVSLLLPFFIVFVPLMTLGIYYGDMRLVLGAALALTVSVSDFYYMYRLRKRKGSLYLLEEKPDKSTDVPGGYILKEIVSIDAIQKDSEE